MSHLTIRTQKADISSLLQREMATEKVRLGPLNRAGTRVSDSKPRALCPAKQPQYVSSFAFCHLCLTQSKIYPFISLARAPCDRKTRRSPDGQVTTQLGSCLPQFHALRRVS